MRPSFQRAARLGLKLLPRPVRGRLIGRVPRFVAYLEESDVVVAMNNPYYGGAKFSLSTEYRIERELMYNHRYDQKTLLYLMRLVKPGDVCVDIGANIGSIALSLAHRVGRSGKVIAFEPGPLLCNRLLRNVALSRFQNVEVICAGLSDFDGILQWRLETGENCGNAFLSEDIEGTPVSVTTLDENESIKRLDRLDFMKIDVEGMELEVIRGAIATIQRFTPTLLIETLFERGAVSEQRVAETLNLLRSLGYDFFEIDLPEAQIIPFTPAFNFIRCAFPAVPQNTLCVHASRFDSIGVRSA